jgi:Zn-dependent protease with chaperone function
MILWQLIALCGGLSMLGALLFFGLADTGALNIVALTSGALLFLHLVFTLVLTGVRMRRRRERHLDALRLVAHESPEARGRLVVDSTLPLAYCLPSTGGSITVVTDGILRTLSADELGAVLAHERAHLTQRHDFLIWAFSAWRTALPWLPTSTLALESVAELIEYLADDTACQAHRPSDLARALLIVSHASSGTDLQGGDDAAAGPLEPATPMEGRTVRRALRLVQPGP